MKTLTFISLADPNKGYTLHSDSMALWDQAYHSNGRPISTWSGKFDTCGDGLIQHGHECCVNSDEIADYLGSLALYIVNLPLADKIEALKILDHRWPIRRHGTKSILFMASLVPGKNGKTRYYNRSKCKVSTAESRKHDRRWFKVPDWANGTVESVFRLLGLDENGESQYGLSRGCEIEKIAEYEQIRDVMIKVDKQPLDIHTTAFRFLELLGDKEGYEEKQNKNLHQSWLAVDNLVKGYRETDNGERQLNCYLQNTGYKDRYSE